MSIEDKHYHEDFLLVNYKVKPWDTMYSLMKNDPEAKKFLTLTKLSTFPKNIKPGDIVSFQLDDNNIAEITINNTVYILNLDRNLVTYNHPEIKNIEYETKKLNEVIIENHLNKIIQAVLNWLPNWKFKPDQVKLLQQLDKITRNSDYNLIIQFFLNYIWPIDSLETLKSYLGPIYQSKKINSETKKLFAKFLKKYVIWLAWEEVDWWYIHDPLKEDKLIWFLEKIAPEYNWTEGIEQDMPLE